MCIRDRWYLDGSRVSTYDGASSIPNVSTRSGDIWEVRVTPSDGEDSGDTSGSSLSLSADGSVVAIGAPYNDGNDTNSGHVRIYQTSSSETSSIASETSSVGIEENTIVVASYTVTDSDAGDTVSWSLSGVDFTLFNISENGELTFKSAPDFETPLGGANDDSNAYSVTVTATDAGGLSDSTNLTINVENINETPFLDAEAPVKKILPFPSFSILLVDSCATIKPAKHVISMASLTLITFKSSILPGNRLDGLKITRSKFPKLLSTSSNSLVTFSDLDTSN